MCHTFDIRDRDIKTIKERVLHFVHTRVSTFSFLDNNQYDIGPNRYELLVGLGVRHYVPYPSIRLFKGKWLFGQLDYEHKPDDNNVESDNTCTIFEPKLVISIPYQSHSLMVEGEEALLLDFIAYYEQDDSTMDMYIASHTTDHQWVAATSRDEYLATVRQIREDIYYGRYYELNYCIQYVIKDITVPPVDLFLKQSWINPSPFAAYFRHGAHHVLSSSMERFVYTAQGRITSQPIKGTIRRMQDKNADEQQKELLQHDIKERAENVMIVDLTRNDLARICKVGSVQVDELFGIYTFPFVHQMISTVSGHLHDDIDTMDIWRYTYPMGSMTGAPKKTVMEHISRYEPVKRGAYSGIIFYIQPDGDMDSSVVIRTLIYDDDSKTIQYHTGSAITYDSDPTQEWEELQLKAHAMKRLLMDE